MPATIAQPISLYSSGVELPKATPWIEASGNIKWPEKYWVTDGSRYVSSWIEIAFSYLH